jgi:hypothetical protein
MSNRASSLSLSSSSDGSEEYEPEYEPVEICVHHGNESQPPLTFRVLSVLPPPIEYLSQLHHDHQEISGRQVWTGSLVLANAMMHMKDEFCQRDLNQKR